MVEIEERLCKWRREMASQATAEKIQAARIAPSAEAGW
jgi:hypothetical protein